MCWRNHMLGILSWRAATLHSSFGEPHSPLRPAGVLAGFGVSASTEGAKCLLSRSKLVTPTGLEPVLPT